MIITDIADGLSRGVGNMTDTLSQTLFEPVIRLGVTGLARSGKTVFITSLVANLMDRARMGGLQAVADGRISGAFLQPQPDVTVPRFDYETHLGALTSPTPHWPDSTRAISELRLSAAGCGPSGLLAGLSGPRAVHLDIVDYPGEWLLDLALLDKSYADWSGDVLTRIDSRAEAADILRLAGAHATRRHRWTSPRRSRLPKAFTAYLQTRPATRGSRIAIRGASCCPAIWPARPC